MRILVAEDDAAIARVYEAALRHRKHDVRVVYNGEDCLKAYKEEARNLGDGGADSDDLPFEVVVLDYRMPKMDGMQVAKEILSLKPRQRIIFASAFVRETLVDSVKQLRQVVELMQKPFSPEAFIDTIEDKQIYGELEKLNVDIQRLKAFEPTHEQLEDLMNVLKRILKHGTL